MSNPQGDPGHGDSPAAWAAVIVMLLGVAAGTVFFFLHMPVFVFASAGIVVLGAILGFILSKAGFGVNGPHFTPKSHD